jgi:hypothetical protein
MKAFRINLRLASGGSKTCLQLKRLGPLSLRFAKMLSMAAPMDFSGQQAAKLSAAIKEKESLYVIIIRRNLE